MPDPVAPDLVSLVLAAADRHGDAPALTGPPRRISRTLRPFAHRRTCANGDEVREPGATLSYAELGARVRGVAAAEKLAHRGPGDLVGVPLPGVRARVDGGGRLVVAGANLARGYLGEPDLYEHTTGDLATLSDGGAIVLGGRATDMIIRGHTNIYPGLHEPAIAALPGVAQAVLVGVPDVIGDERVVLVLVAGPGAPPDLPERVRAALPALLDASALPDEVLQADDVPVAGRTRKIDRAALRDRLVREAGP